MNENKITYAFIYISSSHYILKGLSQIKLTLINGVLKVEPSGESLTTRKVNRVLKNNRIKYSPLKVLTFRVKISS